MRLAAIFLLLIPLAVSGSERGRADNRLLVISAPSLEDPLYRTQTAELVAEWSGLVERDFFIETKMGSKSFSVILVGKDGKEKLRRPAPISSKELFAIVDAMPVRQAEMRAKSR